MDEVYDLFIDVWERAQDTATDSDHFPNQRCDWDSDQRYFDEIDSDAWREELAENGETLGWDRVRTDAIFGNVDLTDHDRIGRTWVTVLAYLMTDFRYLHL